MFSFHCKEAHANVPPIVVLRLNVGMQVCPSCAAVSQLDGYCSRLGSPRGNVKVRSPWSLAEGCFLACRLAIPNSSAWFVCSQRPRPTASARTVRCFDGCLCFVAEPRRPRSIPITTSTSSVYPLLGGGLVSRSTAMILDATIT